MAGLHVVERLLESDSAVILRKSYRLLDQFFPADHQQYLQEMHAQALAQVQPQAQNQRAQMPFSAPAVPQAGYFL